jgi:hypothetical protein
MLFFVYAQSKTDDYFFVNFYLARFMILMNILHFFFVYYLIDQQRSYNKLLHEFDLSMLSFFFLPIFYKIQSTIFSILTPIIFNLSDVFFIHQNIFDIFTPNAYYNSMTI